VADQSNAWKCHIQALDAPSV